MSLKKQLDSPSSPMRQFLGDHESNISFDRARWKQAIAAAEPLLATPDPATGARPPYDVLGHAIGAVIEWEFAPPATAAIIAGGQMVGNAYPSCQTTVDATLTELEGALPDDLERASRLGWFAGLFEQTFRSRRWDSPWYDGFVGAIELEAALASVPTWWVNDISQVAMNARRTLPRGGTAVCGPTFAGSSLVGGADADLILDGVLIDVKATQQPGLRKRDLHQILSYALLDFDDTYGITGVALASARFGAYVQWSLEDVVGDRTALAGLRSQLKVVLEADVWASP